jgi:murein biosynthesis integral membrane protein MurJ
VTDTKPAADSTRAKPRGGLLRQSSFTSMAAAAAIASGLLLDATIAARYGAGRTSDAFFVGARIPLGLVAVVTAAANQALVPTFSTWFTRKGEQDTWPLISKIVTATLVLGLAVAAIGGLAARPLMAATAPGLHGAQLDAAAEVARLMFFVVPLVALAEVLRAVLNARFMFVAPAAMNVVMNGVAAGAILYSGGDHINLVGIAYVLGAGAQLVFMAVTSARRGFRFRPSFRWRDPDIVATGKLSLRPLASASLNPAARIGEQLFTSFLPAGSITVINYGYRLISAIGGSVFFRSVIVALLPRLTEATAEEDEERIGKITEQGLTLMLLLSLPMTAFLAVLAGPAAVVVFKRGNLNRSDAVLLGTALAIYAGSLVGSAVQRALLAPFFASLNTLVPWRNTLYGVMANLQMLPVLLLVVGLHSRYAALAVPVSYSVAQYVNVVHAWYCLRRLQHVKVRARAAFRMATASALTAAALYAMSSALELPSTRNRLELTVRGAMCAVVGAAVLILTLAFTAAVGRRREQRRRRVQSMRQSGPSRKTPELHPEASLPHPAPPSDLSEPDEALQPELLLDVPVLADGPDPFP